MQVDLELESILDLQETHGKRRFPPNISLQPTRLRWRSGGRLSSVPLGGKAGKVLTGPTGLAKKVVGQGGGSADFATEHVF